MTIFANLSDEPLYNIKSVARQTGIAPTTLRAWERRHNILVPQRSIGNYRLYSDRQVAQLRWLKGKVEGGLSISHAAVALAKLGKEETPFMSPREWEALQNQLYDALIGMDESAAYALLSQAQPLQDACAHLITPVLVKIGEGWHEGRVGVVAEHFASQLLMAHLFRIFNSFPNGDGDLVVVGCAPKELHQIGSLMLAVLLRKEGVNVRYLGADVPLDDWNSLIRTRQPAVVAVSCSQIEFGHRLLMMLPFPDKPAHKHPDIVLGGMAFAGFANSYPNKPNIYVERTLADGVERIINLLAR